MKGISRKGFTTTTLSVTKHIGGNANEQFNTSVSYMNPFHLFTRLGSTTGTGDVNALVPQDLIGMSETASQEFVRHAMMYRQYRIKCIRWEFVPTNAVTGRESILSGYAGAPRSGVTTDEVAGLMDRNTIASSMQWHVRWPMKNGTFNDWGVGLYGSGPAGSNLNNQSAQIDPSTIKVPVTEKFILFWKPKILGVTLRRWIDMNTAASSGNTITSLGKSSAKSFPWCDVLDNLDGIHSVPDAAQWTAQNLVSASLGTASTNLTSFRQPLTQPAIGIYDMANNVYLDTTSLAPYVCGRWTMHTVVEFRHKMRYTAAANVPNFNQSTGVIVNAQNDTAS